MRLVVDQAHLADVVAGLQVARITSRPRHVGGDDAGTRPVSMMNSALTFLALLDNGLAFALEAALDHRSATALGLRGGQHGKQGHPANQIELVNIAI
jgi:hypothetical protein